jgi:hypothetical protein
MSTSLASALHSVETSWQGSPQYTSANAAIYSAAPDDVKSSIDSNGYYYRSITGQDWYTKSVPHAVQTAVVGEISAFSSVGAKILSSATNTGNAAPASQCCPSHRRCYGLGWWFVCCNVNWQSTATATSYKTSTSSQDGILGTWYDVRKSGEENRVLLQSLPRKYWLGF